MLRASTAPPTKPSDGLWLDISPPLGPPHSGAALGAHGGQGLWLTPGQTQTLQAQGSRRYRLGLRAQPTPAEVPATAEQPALFIGRHGTRLSAQAIWQRLRQRSLQAGLSTPVHPHMLRHSFASHVLQSSSDLRAVQELLGHANISTTQVYTRLDFQHLAQAYDAAHPRARKK